MRWHVNLIGLLACTHLANAVSFTTSKWTGIINGDDSEVAWKDASGSVRLTLVDSKKTAVNTIASGLTSSPYDWTPGDKALANTIYMLAITDSKGTAYSSSFTVAAAENAAGASTTSSSSTTKKSTSSTTTSKASTTTSKVTTTTSKASTTTSKATTSGKTSSTSDTTSSEESTSSETPTSTTTIGQATSTPTGTQNAATTSSGVPTETAAPATGMSTGAKAGIGVGAALGAIGIAGLGVAGFFWRKKHAENVVKRGTDRLNMAENGSGGGFPPGGPSNSGPPGGPAGSSAWQAQNETNLAGGIGGGYRGVRGVSSTGTTVSSMSDPMNLPPMTPASLVPGGYQAPRSRYSPPNQYSQPSQSPAPNFQTPRQIYMAYNGPSTPAVAEMGGHSANDSRTLSGVSEIASTSDGRPHDARSLGGISAMTMPIQDDPRHVSGVPVAQSPVPQRKAVPSKPEIGGGGQPRYEMA